MAFMWEYIFLPEIVNLTDKNCFPLFQATQELREYVKDPGVVPALCTVITASQNVQVGTRTVALEAQISVSLPLLIVIIKE